MSESGLKLVIVLGGIAFLIYFLRQSPLAWNLLAMAFCPRRCLFWRVAWASAAEWGEGAGADC